MLIDLRDCISIIIRAEISDRVTGVINDDHRFRHPFTHDRDGLTEHHGRRQEHQILPSYIDGLDRARLSSVGHDIDQICSIQC